MILESINMINIRNVLMPSNVIFATFYTKKGVLIKFLKLFSNLELFM